MADVITRFKLETTQFDSKLRDASKNIAQLTNHLSLAGKDFDKFAKNNVEAAKSLGSIQSGATNLKDKLKDLVGAFNETARAYNSLTQEQKSTDFGRALASSLQELHGRIRETKDELSSTGGVLSSLKEKFVINFDATKMLSMGLQACNAALGVVKDAFLSSESNIDEWGRTVKSAEVAYDTFLNALNTGNWSNFFQNLSTAIQGGRDLYDALDRLGSVRANNEAAIALVEAEIQKLRVLKQQGEDVDDKIKDATDRLRRLRGEAVKAGVNAGKTDIRTTLRNQVNARNTTGVQVTDSQLGAAANRVLKEGQSYIDGMAKLVRYYENSSKFQTPTVNYMGVGGQASISNQFDLSKLSKTQQQQYLIAKAITEGETKIQQGIGIFAQAVREGGQANREQFRNNRYALQGSGGGGSDSTKTKEKELTIQQQIAELEKEAYTASEERRAEIAIQVKELDKELERQKQIRNEIHGIVADVKEVAMATGFSGVTQNGISAWKSAQQSALGGQQIGSQGFNDIAANIVDTTTLQTVLNESIKNGITIAPDTVEGLWEQILNGANIPDNVWQELQEFINAQLQELGIEPIKLDLDTGGLQKVVKESKDMQKEWQAAASAISAVGSAMSQIENPAAKVAGTIAQAIASVALGYAQATTQAASMGPWAWIAFAAAGLATMVATISQIKSATKGGFADGGIVPGNNYSGDMLNTATYGINSGELVLNRAQTGIIASQLQGSEGGIQPRNSYISGEQIVTVVNAYGRRTGRGEILR